MTNSNPSRQHLPDSRSSVNEHSDGQARQNALIDSHSDTNTDPKKDITAEKLLPRVSGANHLQEHSGTINLTKLSISKQLQSSQDWLQVYKSPHHTTDQDLRGLIFTCANIDQITIKRKLGQGVTKQVFLGFYEGKKVAVKMITRNVIDITSCLKKLKRNATGIDPADFPKERQRCFTLPNMKLMKEVLLLHQINHPNLLKLLGYCVRSEETESTSLQDHGVLAVYEYAIPFYPSTLASWPWHLRVKTAFELADLLHYLQNSPLGSLRISDFKDIHFLLKDGRIKLTDLDDMTSLEPKCRLPIGNTLDSISHLHPQLPIENPLPVDLAGRQQGLDVSPSHDSQTADKLALRAKNTLSFDPPPGLGGSPTNPLYPSQCGYNLRCTGGICPGSNALHNLAHMNRIYFQNLLLGDCGAHTEKCETLRTRLDNLDITAMELKEYLYQMMTVPFVPGYS